MISQKEFCGLAIPLNYQISEYDCGPVCLLNALNVLFDRKLIQPCLIKAVYNYTLDCCDSKSRPGQRGTSAAALRFIGEWMNEYGQSCGFPIHCESLRAEDVALDEGGVLNRALANGAVAVTRCVLCVGHYVLITGAHDGVAELWDPYHIECRIRKPSIEIVTDEPYHCNRRVRYAQMNTAGKGYYSLGDPALRECLLLYNTARSTGSVYPNN